MAESVTQEKRGGASDPVSDAALPFRFEVSWRFLTQTAAPRGAATPKTNKRSVSVRVRAPQPVLVVSPVVVAANPVVDPPPRLEPPPPIHAPAFEMAANPDPTSKSKMLIIAGLMGVVLIGAAMTMGRGSALRDGGAAATMEMGGGGWLNEWVSDRKGSSVGRQLSLYRPSIGMSDYRLEFTGRILHNSLGWVFREADTKNYYVAKIGAPEPGGRLVLTRFAVIKGVEGPRTRLTLPMLAGAGPLRVRLDARKSRFTISLQNEVVDDWQDDRLMSGGVGFLNEREEQGQVDSVQISFLKGVSDR